MSIEQMEYMLALEEERKISYAAKKCFISQPALSQQLAKIEKEYNVSLFNKTNQEYLPTEEGKILLNAFRAMLQIYRNALSQTEKHRVASQTDVTLGLPALRAGLLYPYIAPRFARNFPAYQLHLKETAIRATPELLKSRVIDFGLYSPSLRVAPHFYEEFSAYPLFDEELVLAVSKAHPLCGRVNGRGELTDLHLLEDQCLAVYEKKSIVRGIIDTCFEKHRVNIGQRIELKNGSTILQFVKKGLAVAILPEMFVIGQPELKSIRLRPRLTQKICLLSLKRYQGKLISDEIVRLMQQAFASYH